MASFRCSGTARGYAEVSTSVRPVGFHVTPPICVTAPHLMMRGRHARLASRDYSGSAIL